MRIAYFDCFSGISGDMCMGALIDAGAPLDDVVKGIKGLRLKKTGLSVKKAKRSGILATKIDIETGEALSGGWKEASKTVNSSSLPAVIKKKALRIIKGIYEAEAKVHGIAMGRVHLHELADSMIDVAGTLIALERLGIERVFSSPLNLGSGEARTEHGRLPVPAPATAELIKGIPVYSDGTPYELTTPTGAAIIKGVSSGFGNMPLINIEETGCGAGSRDIKGKPNVLRVFIGEAFGGVSSDVTIIETNIDDMDPRIYEYVTERLMKKGALDVYLTNIIMKKGRPAVKLSVLCREEDRERLTDMILAETTTIGVRFWRAGRSVLERKIKTVKTPYGRIRIKESLLPGGNIRVSPEYEDCKGAAEKRDVPLMDVMKAAQRRTR